jgi:hypothetical protein
MFEKIGKWALVLGVVAIFILAWALYSTTKQVKELETSLNEVRELAGAAALPKSVYTQITALQNQVEVLERQGPDSIIVTQHHYIPSESEVRYVVEQDTLVWTQIQQLNREMGYLWAMGDTVGFNEVNAALEKLKYSLFHTKVVFSTHGWCTEPFIGGAINDESVGEVNIGARLGYWNRFGIGAQGDVGFPTDSTIELGISGGADWRIPHLDNTAIFVGGGYNFTRSDWQARFGLHVYLK